MLFRTSIAVAGISGICLLAVGLNDRLSVRASPASETTQDAAYVMTGSISGMSRVALALTDEQREVMYQGVMRFPDAMGRGERPPELTEELSGDEPLQDLPASVTAEAPLLSAYKFMKLEDRILLIEPAARVVVAMIPRYKLLP
jgi:hypothetical protein